MTPVDRGPGREPRLVDRVDLLASDRRARIRAIRHLAVVPGSAALAFALRRVLFTDADAVVRAAAARRLGAIAEAAARATAADVEAWLLDALGDASPLVRDAILRGLALCGTGAASPALRALARHDRTWWVRRAAIYTLAAIAAPALGRPLPAGGAASGEVSARGEASWVGSDELAALEDALQDPFWRVRHAAVKILAVLGAGDPAVRAQVLATPASNALMFLRATWGPVAIEAPDRAARAARAARATGAAGAADEAGEAAAASTLPAALLDPDPAVVTARLAADRTTGPRALVELLCDPHVPLRILAAERIAASGDREAYRAVLDWLEEPRIPHVADTVDHLLDGLGDPAAELAAHALGRVDRLGAARWAIGWVVATRFDTLYGAALDRARAEPALRGGALAIAGDDELVRWAAGAPGELCDAIAAELHARPAQASHDALLALDPGRPRVRALQIDVHARRGAWPLVEAALADPHHGPRAVAARWCVRAGHSDALALARDPDPAVREAALDPRTALELAPALVDDIDPFVARAAIERLVSAFAGQRVLPVPVAAATRRALGSPDPWIRAQACRMPIDDALLAIVVERLGDPDEMVRAAAHEALANGEVNGQAIDARLDALLDTAVLSELGRAMSHAWRSRTLDDAALGRARAALETEAHARSRDVLAAVAGIELAPPAAIAGSPAARPSRHGAPPAGTTAETTMEATPRPMMEATPRATPATLGPTPGPTIDRREVGRAGFSIAPLVISGAFDLSPAALEVAAEAGVDAWFWEPSYDSLTAHLRATRHERGHVIAGSYHADAAAVEADVDHALRRLGRDVIDVFLLFWSRSPARVDAKAFAMLDQLKRAGKVRAAGFSTHHRELARAAIEASPWDAVMIRHSAAHPGIEAELLPAARQAGTAILTFSALCYGRMLSGPGAPSPADCYRYSLSQPGVVGCISAPRRRRELVENLEVLRAPTLDPAQLAALRAHGVGVRAENQRFNTLMRQPTRDAAAAARELLAAELPPDDEATVRALPRASTARRSRTSLGTTRRRR
jgi:hypothetical protein